ncbi:expressed unknown protein [Seminavis robusta]|uniref:Uncharacterized protein n=1 Tax=Seminavis robusta TaxID=568900 RepID=A0A9N8HE54_9STRA|nr:expressed unknown protein [Seminavis robusta]|eukprot:Sro373_g128950.1 n/a (633) ;mRNA; r:8658-10728
MRWWLCLVLALTAAALARAVEGRNPFGANGLQRTTTTRTGFFLGSRSPYAHLPEFKASRTELLEKITTLNNENSGLKTQVTEYANTRSKSNTYMQSIEKLLMQQFHARRKNWVLRCIAALFRLVFDFGKQVNHQDLLLEEIRNSSFTIQLLEEEVTKLQFARTDLEDQLVLRNFTLQNLQVQLRSATQEQEKLKRSLRNRKEREKHNRAIAKLQEQVDKAKKEISRLISQKDALAETKDKERLSFQLRIEQKQTKIDRLEEELDQKRQRVSELKAEVAGILNQRDNLVARDHDYAEMQRENSQMKAERIGLQTRINILEATVQSAQAEEEQSLEVQRRTLQSKIDSLGKERKRLDEANAELSRKLDRLDHENLMAKAKEASQQQAVEAQVRRELKASMSNDRKELTARIHSLESEQSRSKEENEELKSELSSLQQKYDEAVEKQQNQADEHEMDEFLADRDSWKERADKLEAKVALAHNSAEAASQENISLKQQLKEAQETNRALQSRATEAERVLSEKQENSGTTDDYTNNSLELEILQRQWKQTQQQSRAKLAEIAKNGHEDCCQEVLISNDNTQEHMEKLAHTWRENHDQARKRLEELSKTTDGRKSTPFVPRGTVRPAFGLTPRNKGD